MPTSGNSSIRRVSQLLTKEERNAEVRKVISKLTELRITVEFEAVRELFKMMSSYVSDGIRQEINIEFPEFSRRIKGVLSTSTNENVWVKLEKL
jgi:hypothetical protein